jgi:hypothetical protein
MNAAMVLVHLFVGSLGFAVKVSPAVVLLGGGSATAARTGGASQQFPESLFVVLGFCLKSR